MSTVALIRPSVDIAGDALSLEIRRAGQRMESAYAAGHRDVAQVWMACMYGLIRARNAAIHGPDIKAGGVA